MVKRFQALGPLQAGEGSRAFLGLSIAEDNRCKPVVIIWVPDEASTNPTLLAKIQRETEHAARLDHPNIVTVMGFATLEEGPARVVEFADGESLRKILEVAKTLPMRIAARVIADACTGTHYAHVAGNDDGSPLVHGDLRPETMLISFSGTTKVTGFGALAFAPRELGGQRVKGRRIHSAPEQVIGGRSAITIPTDVYLLGIAFYECLTGQVPWADQGDYFDHAVLTLPLPPASPGSIDPRLETIIWKACSKKATERYQTPLEMRQAIETAMGDDLASSTELSRYLESLFPQSHQLRADRRRTIDTGIADFVRKQWSGDGQAPKLATEPSMPAVKIAAPAGRTLEFQPVKTPMATRAVKLPPHATAQSWQSLSEIEPVKNKKSSSLPWLLLLAAFVAAIAIVWAINKANQSPYPKGEGPSEVAKPIVKKQDPVAAAIVPSVEPIDAGMPVAVVPVAPIVPVAPNVPVAPIVPVVPVVPTTPVLPSEVAVSISSTPPTELFLEGKSLGKTPWSGRLAPGKKVFTLVNAEELIKATRVINVRGEPVEQNYSFEKGFVTVNAPEGSLIFIDGNKVGAAPIRGEIPVPEGSHRISVTVGKAKWGEDFTVRAKQKVNFNIEPQ
jgi:eukaryotic-like serine/threonine-protein kinase